MNKNFKKLAACLMATASIVTGMVGIGTSATDITDEVPTILIENYEDVSVETVEELSNYNTVMGKATFRFTDAAWQDDSVTYYANISTSDNLAIGTLYCYYEDNVGTDKVTGSYDSSYYHYCHTATGNNNSGLSATEDPYVTAYNSTLSYASGADVTVKGFALT